MTNYQKSIEIETLKRILNPVTLRRHGADLCMGCEYMHDSKCIQKDGDFTCRERLAAWLNEPYDDWGE